MSRLCMRPGCDRDAASRLSYDAVGCQVWLDELTERAGRHQEICLLHAERLTVPRGWFLCDRRSAQPAMFVTPAAPDAAEAPTAPTASAGGAADSGQRARSPRRRRRSGKPTDPATQTLELFEVLRQELAAPAVAEPAVPQPAVAVVEPQPTAEPRPTDDLEPDEQVPELLRATSPLLARAFAASGHQRSVLTQPGPVGPSQPIAEHAEGPSED